LRAVIYSLNTSIVQYTLSVEDIDIQKACKKLPRLQASFGKPVQMK